MFLSIMFFRQRIIEPLLEFIEETFPVTLGDFMSLKNFTYTILADKCQINEVSYIVEMGDKIKKASPCFIMTQPFPPVAGFRRKDNTHADALDLSQ